jgi:hypothetical protein
MSNTEKLVLIEGVFLEEEAKDILMNIFSAKINFHRLKNLGAHQRYGLDDPNAKERIPQLKAEVEKLQQLLSEAKGSSRRLAIHSEISISLVED